MLSERAIEVYGACRRLDIRLTQSQALRPLIVKSVHLAGNRNAAWGGHDVELPRTFEVPSRLHKRAADLNWTGDQPIPRDSFYSRGAAYILHGDARDRALCGVSAKVLQLRLPLEL